MPDTSAERVRRYRGHKAGDHGDCSPLRCLHRRQIDEDYREHMSIIAIFGELDRLGIDPREFFHVARAWYGNYREVKAKRDRVFPDWCSLEWDEITETDRIIAQSFIHLAGFPA